LGTYGSPPTEAGELEIEQQGELKPGDGKLTSHFGDVGIDETGRDLRVDDDQINPR
jgi:hypothetical protein